MPANSTEIIDRYTVLKRQIASYAETAHRHSDDIKLVAVSKHQPPSKILALYHAGQQLFGENRIDELIDKKHELAAYNIEWHFIGNIQSKKTRLITENCDWVQSLDNLSHAKRLNSQRPNNLKPLSVCIQINISQEPQKGGIAPDQLLEFARNLHNFKHLQLRGLMAIIEKSADELVVISQFRSMQKLFEQLKLHFPGIDTLSMGMTQDYMHAIQAGSTMLRIGSYLFEA